MEIEKGTEPYLPEQFVPGPVKPDLQVHVKAPFVFVQSALE